ncbi:CHASE2 and HATPase_c domain-containing protein [Burkholderia perseverans]|uniref:CHASE2 and HATPase_c domain-containing protein n=1 Tax=Burkholderia perseverans TaxID=2615214 RepID=UPI001FEE5367|nr:CHASE2 and HATPase_c domain-containing protein [Burkholderia perseverans]
MMKRKFPAFGRRAGPDAAAPARPYPDLAREWPGLAVVLLLVCLVLAYTGILQRADLAFLDLASRSMHRSAVPRVIVAAIDARTLERLGGWPLRLDVQARLIDRLTEAGVAAVGLNLTGSAESDAAGAQGRAAPDGLAALVAAIRRNGHVVLRHPVTAADGLDGADGADDEALIDALANASYAAGQAELLRDADGIYRGVPLLAGTTGLEPHVAALLLRASGSRAVFCDEAEIAAAARHGRGCLRYLPFGAARGYQTVSYLDVLQGRVPADLLRGHIVLIGATAAGLAARLATPAVYGPPLNCIGFLAEATNALASATPIRPAGRRLALLFNLSVVPLLCFALSLLGPRASLLAVVGLACGLTGAAWALLRLGHVFVPAAAGVLTCALAYPLWAWRSQEALLAYLSREAARAMPPAEHDARDARDSRERPRGGRHATGPLQRRRGLMASLVRDVHDHRELVAEWVDSLPEATLVGSAQGTVLLANAQVLALARRAELAGDGQRSPLGRRVADVLFEITASHRAVEFASQALALLAPRADGTAAPAQALTRLAQGIEITHARGARSLLIKCAPLRPGAARPAGLIFHVADVSSVRMAERQRDMALRFLSHDMRSPQAAMLALVEQMRETPPRFTAERFVELVAHYATTALTLSDDFIFLARAESAPPRLASVDPALVLGDAVDDLWPQASARATTVELIAEPGATTLADVQLLRRAFGNLIGNAIKFSPRDSTIRVRLAMKGRHLIISVIDPGIGMSAQDRRNLFREYGQFDARLAREGHGLGLAFVKSVVDSLGGRLLVRSALGRGTIFSMRLPRLAGTGP